MASIHRRGRGSHTAHWDQELLLDKDALVAFAAEATATLRRESSALAKLRRPSPFFAILSSLLSDVEGRLEKPASLTESRVSELLATLERLAKASIHLAAWSSSIFRSC